MLVEELERDQKFQALFSVEGEPESISRLVYVGPLGNSDWLHFINIKTRENHLCKPHQFPEHTWRNGKTRCKLRYEPIK